MSVVITMEAVHTNVSTQQVVIDVSVPMDKQDAMQVSTILLIHYYTRVSYMKLVTETYYLIMILTGESCSSNNGGCSHKCTNRRSGVLCSCNSGYELQSDKKSCRG